MIPTTTQITAQLDDLISHAGGWSRVLHLRAGRLNAEEGQPLREAAEVISDAARSLRWRSSLPETSPTDLLAVADRSLARAHVLRTALEAERDLAASDAPDDASWLTHEIKALERVSAARRDLISLPARGETPTAELEAMKTFCALLGREIIIDFEGGKDEIPSVNVALGASWDDLPDGVGLEATGRLMILADRLIRCDIPSWDEAPGAEGMIRIGPDEAPWLDAVDHAEDWLLERTIDLEELAEMSWEPGRDETPEP